MIKLNIYKKSEEVKHELKLDLNTGDDGITLVSRDENGNIDWCLLTIRFDGTFEKCEGLPNDIGLQVSENGRIIEREEN